MRTRQQYSLCACFIHCRTAWGGRTLPHSLPCSIPCPWLLQCPLRLLWCERILSHIFCLTRIHSQWRRWSWRRQSFSRWWKCHWGRAWPSTRWGNCRWGVGILACCRLFLYRRKLWHGALHRWLRGRPTSSLMWTFQIKSSLICIQAVISIHDDLTL